MSSSSQNSRIDDFSGERICYCGVPSPLLTSWTDSNPGRRFYSCGNYQRGNPCQFFAWFDPPMEPRAKAVILGLLRKLDRIERERAVEFPTEVVIEEERKEGWSWASLFCVVVGIFISYVLFRNV